ncbi:MAG: nitrate reductase [Actinomycetales bacterium]|nr:nitrate reductase [Actinomycetales bacterium]
MTQGTALRERLGFVGWRLHGDGKVVTPGEIVKPGERLGWWRSIGLGGQHVLAMFGSTILVPRITEFPVAPTLFFSAVGTILFLLITKNRLPSYLGSSFAFIVPIGVATASGGVGAALFGILMTGVLLVVAGVVVHFAGPRWIQAFMPPVVTGTIVALIGFNLAPVAWGNVDADGNPVSGFRAAPVTAAVTLGAILLATVLFRGILGRLSILLGIVVGYLVALWRGEVVFTDVEKASWFGLPDFQAPTVDFSVVLIFLPVVLVLIAENIGHVKSVSTMTGENYDPLMGRALIADGLATTLAGAGGGSGTTTYAENIGVMAASRVYSTAAYWFAGFAALMLSFSPKFAELIYSIPVGVIGGAATLLFGMIGMLGARIWVQNKVDFGDPANLMSAGVGLVIAIAGFVFVTGDGLRFDGIVLGTAATLVIYHGMRFVGRWRGTSHEEAATPAAVPAAPATDVPDAR